MRDYSFCVGKWCMLDEVSVCVMSSVCCADVRDDLRFYFQDCFKSCVC